MADAKKLVELVRDAIDKGATSVEDVHKTIMDQPYDIIEKVAPTLEKPVNKVKGVQDRTVGSVYNVIRAINRDVAEIATGLLEPKAPESKPEKPEETTKEA